MPDPEFLLGDCREVMATLPEASIDSIITDPPYDLVMASRNGSQRNPGSGPFGRHREGTKPTGGFMGKDWDATGVAFDPETWLAALRVAKPGAFLLAFGGTRTWHRMAVAIEDAGWEIRDTMGWFYGSGFPKSLDISKAIDKAAGAKREVVGVRPGHEDFAHRTDAHSAGARREGWDRPWKADPEKVAAHHMQTAPATDAARQWSGWGTALKPAWEPIIVAMKPLDGTFAANAEKHGVAGLHIDGARIASEKITTSRNTALGRMNDDAWKPTEGMEFESHAAGRFPANLILDEEAGRMLDEQAGPQQSGGTPVRRPGVAAKTKNTFGDFAGQENPNGIGRSEGNVSRFFYTAKASRAERGEYNNHPTVKPLDLMTYLCKLTRTPTGGKVLDPFAGSGTTALACLIAHREFIGIEQSQEFIEIAGRRVADFKAETPLFK